jgi:hypothetical protein
MSTRPPTVFLGITVVVQVVLGVMFVTLVMRPFYANGLDEVSFEEIESGLYDPSYFYPFCYAPPDASGSRDPRCHDDTAGNSAGNHLLSLAITAACGGPWIGGIFTVLSTLIVLRRWERLGQGGRILGVIGVVVSFAAFILMAHRGPLFMYWFMD